MLIKTIIIKIFFYEIKVLEQNHISITAIMLHAIIKIVNINIFAVFARRIILLNLAIKVLFLTQVEISTIYL